jgi:hypothetical protein
MQHQRYWNARGSRVQSDRHRKMVSVGSQQSSMLLQHKGQFNFTSDLGYGVQTESGVQLKCAILKALESVANVGLLGIKATPVISNK